MTILYKWKSKTTSDLSTSETLHLYFLQENISVNFPIQTLALIDQ